VFTDLFDAATVARFAEDFTALLEQVLTDADTPILALRLPHGRRVVNEAGPGIPRRRTQSEPVDQAG